MGDCDLGWGAIAPRRGLYRAEWRGRREGKGLKKSYWSLLLLLGPADIAIAQSSNLPPTVGAAARPNSSAPARRIGLRAAVDASYDSNVFGISRAREFTLGGRSKSDISITPSVQIDAFVPLGRNSVFVRGLVGYDFYVENSQLNRERIDLDGGGTVQVASTCTVSPNISYGRARSNAGDVFIVTGDPALVRRNVEERMTLGAEAACSRSSGLSLTAGYNHTTFRNSAPIFKQNDLDQDGFNGSIGYQRPTLGRLAIYGNYSTVEYLKRLDITGRPDLIRSYGTGLQFERNIGSRASASISAGYSWVEPRSNTGKFSGSSYSASLNLRPSDRLSVDLLISRSVDFATSTFASFTISENYALNGTYRLSQRLSANFGASQQKRDFRFSNVLPGINLPISNDVFTRAYGGLVYDLNRRLRLNALISQQKRDSKDVFALSNSEFDYNNTTVSIGASISFGR